MAWFQTDQLDGYTESGFKDRPSRSTGYRVYGGYYARYSYSIQKVNGEGPLMIIRTPQPPNWMGILSQGLGIAPPEAPVTGYMVSIMQPRVIPFKVWMRQTPPPPLRQTGWSVSLLGPLLQILQLQGTCSLCIPTKCWGFKIVKISSFFSFPVHMHGGLICIAFHPSVCDVRKNQTRKKIHISESIKARSLKLHHCLLKWVYLAH